MAYRFRQPALALALAAFAAVASADDRPPTSLHLVGDHWTAWNPPATLPPDAKVHIVVKGDTLWDLAQTYLGNSYLWPQIWEKNQYVLDAHWIYPGDPLVVGVEVAPASQAAVEPQPAGEMTVAVTEGEDEDDDASRRLRPDSAAARRNTPIPLGSERDIHCTGFISELDEALPWGIAGSEYDELVPRIDAAKSWTIGKGIFGRIQTVKYQLSLGDVVYLDSGRAAGLSAGMILLAIEPKDVVRDPESRKSIGRYNAYLGRVRVLTALDDRSIAEVVQNCEGLRVGARMRTFEPEPVPLARRPANRPVNDPTLNDLSAAPQIVHADSSLFSLGEDTVVFIDRGESDDVYPGDIFTIYRTALGRGDLPIPIGELGVLSVRPHSATAKIIEARYPVYIGDRLERH
ncbi:MAG: LysM peptidoglycan-binding domain-containing protein [Candidatus Binatia bacterium]